MLPDLDNSNEPRALLKQALDALKQHRHTVILSSVLLSIAGIVSISFLPNTYRATTTILVDPQKIPERYISSTITSDPNAHLNTLTQQVLSTSRIQEVIDDLKLYPELRAKKTREEIVELIRAKIKIELKPGSEQGLSSFSITYTDTNRLLVAPVANMLATNFIDWNLKTRQQQATVTTQFLSSELDQAQKSLESQEAALEAFRMQHAGATPDQLDGNLQALSRLQSDVQSNRDAVSRLDEERILLTQLRPTETRESSAPSERSLLLLERNRLDAEIQTLQRQYTDTYPDVISARAEREAVQAKLATMPASSSSSARQSDPGTQLRLSLIEREIERHKQQLNALDRQMGAYQSKVQSVPVLETQLAELTRNYETSRQNYQSLLDKKLSAGMSEDLERKQQAERFTVLDLASTPEKPFKPARLLFFTLAIAGSFLLSSAVAIAHSFTRGAIQSESELVALLPKNISVMATVPPIMSEADFRKARRAGWQTAALSLAACAALIAFLLKMRPTL